MALLPVSFVYDVVGASRAVTVTLAPEPVAHDFAVRVTVVGCEPPVRQPVPIWGVEEADATHNALRVALVVLESSDEARAGALRVAPSSRELRDFLAEVETLVHARFGNDEP